MPLGTATGARHVGLGAWRPSGEALESVDHDGAKDAKGAALRAARSAS